MTVLTQPFANHSYDTGEVIVSKQTPAKNSDWSDRYYVNHECAVLQSYHAPEAEIALAHRRELQRPRKNAYIRYSGGDEG